MHNVRGVNRKGIDEYIYLLWSCFPLSSIICSPNGENQVARFRLENSMKLRSKLWSSRWLPTTAWWCTNWAWRCSRDVASSRPGMLYRITTRLSNSWVTPAKRRRPRFSHGSSPSAPRSSGLPLIAPGCMPSPRHGFIIWDICCAISALRWPSTSSWRWPVF